jgi:citrate lyase subunit beta/citryl-CoA lyase
MRSLLIVPTGDERKLADALTSGADGLIIDLLGSIGVTDGAAARSSAAAFLREVAQVTQRPRIFVRVHPPKSGETDLDLDAVMPAAPDGIFLPGSLNGASVQQLGVKLAVREAQYGLKDEATRIIAIAAENARAIFGLESYVGCSRRLDGLAWDAEALSLELGLEGGRLPGGADPGPLGLARNLTRIGACAACVRAIDCVFREVQDLTALRAQALVARRDGFSAKMAIDPIQVKTINEVFSVAPEAR